MLIKHRKTWGNISFYTSYGGLLSSPGHRSQISVDKLVLWDLWGLQMTLVPTFRSFQKPQDHGFQPRTIRTTWTTFLVRLEARVLPMYCNFPDCIRSNFITVVQLVSSTGNRRHLWKRLVTDKKNSPNIMFNHGNIVQPPYWDKKCTLCLVIPYIASLTGVRCCVFFIFDRVDDTWWGYFEAAPVSGVSSKWTLDTCGSKKPLYQQGIGFYVVVVLRFGLCKAYRLKRTKESNSRPIGVGVGDLWRTRTGTLVILKYRDKKWEHTVLWR